VRGYSALQIGETMFVSGLCMFATAPIAGRLSAKVDPRIMMAIGFSGFAAGTWIVTGITKDWDFYELLWPQILRGCSLMLCMIPINNIALGTLPPARMKNASGLYNLTRNLGGAVGLALINTALNDRWDLHLARLHERFTWTNPMVLERLDSMAKGFSGLAGNPDAMALKAMMNTVRMQGLLMSFSDVFLILTVLFVLMACATPMIRRPRPGGAGADAH
jgi:DHA2 family multidrug resistance protein